MKNLDKEYFVSFVDEAEKLKFVDDFSGLAMNNWRAPFRAQFIDNEALLLMSDFFLTYFGKNYPHMKFSEAEKGSFKYLTFRSFGKDIKPSWIDPITGEDNF